MPVRVLRSLREVEASRWNALDARGSPFLRHEFLLALESSGAATDATGWQAQHLLLEDDAGQLQGALPLYLKSHSWGEFVFDFAWAEAYQRAGLAYYPRLVAAVPFTPATSPRLLLHPAEDPAAVRGELLAAARALAQTLGVSSLHLLFCDDADRGFLEAGGLMPRLDCQFHWRDAGYGDFDGFLDGMTALKRKKIRRERRRVAEAGIRFETRHGDELDETLMATLFALHADTFARHGNMPYLTPQFFRQVAADLPRALVVEFAWLDAEPVACAIFFRGADTLYGRYWGAAGDFHSLHFEACYYRGIEYCLRSGLSRFEPGTQGEHKLLRGFHPSEVWSLHEVADPRFAGAIDDWLRRERSQVAAYIEGARQHLPFRRTAPEATLSLDVRNQLAAEE